MSETSTYQPRGHRYDETEEREPERPFSRLTGDPEPSQRHAVIHPHKSENDMAHPATKKRGGNPDVKHKLERQKPKGAMERKLEQGLEESMAGSDPVSVTQAPKAKHKVLKKGNRVYWRGDAADSGIITEMSWDAVTIAWDNGQLATVHHGDMREIQRAPSQPTTASKPTLV